MLGTHCPGYELNDLAVLLLGPRTEAIKLLMEQKANSPYTFAPASLATAAALVRPVGHGISRCHTQGRRGVPRAPSQSPCKKVSDVRINPPRPIDTRKPWTSSTSYYMSPFRGPTGAQSS